MGKPTSLIAAQIGSNAGSKKNRSPGLMPGSPMPPRPFSLAQYTSCTAWSMSVKAIVIWPRRRCGISAQKSTNQRLYARRPAS
jgi:hypothetical protein